MDHLRNSDRDVDAGNAVRLHHGWVYSHLADIGGRSCGDAVDQWPPSRMKRRYKSKGDGMVQPLSRSSELSRVICLFPVLRLMSGCE